MHGACPLNGHAVDECLLRVSARLHAGRTRPNGSSALDEIVDQRSERLERIYLRRINSTFAHEVDGSAGQEHINLHTGGDCAIGDCEGD